MRAEHKFAPLRRLPPLSGGIPGIGSPEIGCGPFYRFYASSGTRDIGRFAESREATAEKKFSACLSALSRNLITLGAHRNRDRIEEAERFAKFIRSADASRRCEATANFTRDVG